MFHGAKALYIQTYIHTGETSLTSLDNKSRVRAVRVFSARHL